MKLLGSNARECELFRRDEANERDYACIVNQIATTTMATTIAPQTTGVTFFDPPLRGESLAAWSNSLFISSPAETKLPENRAHLVPQRLVLAIAVVPGRRRLRGTDGIGRRKAVDQAGLQFRVGVPIGRKSLMRMDGVLVMRRRIEFL